MEQKQKQEDEHNTHPSAISRRKLLASMGVFGMMTTVGAGGWSAVAGSVTESTYSGHPGNSGHPGAPGHSSDKPGRSRSNDDSSCCACLNITASPYNAVPGGTVDATAAFEQALADAGEGGCIYVPAGDYLVSAGFTISSNYVKLTGTGRLILGNSIWLNGDGFTCSGLRFKAANTTSQIRGIRADTTTAGRKIERITIDNCEFEDFFYATDFRGNATDLVADIAVLNCKSTAPVGKNAGHFQNVFTINTVYCDNKCYHGQNATSYNFFGGNGKIKIIGNYDYNNSYGSCEIENCPNAEVIVSANNFDKKLWIDDSSTVVIDGNIVKELIFVTVQDNDCDRLVISNNITGRIFLSSFGTYRAGKIKNADISHNQMIGPGSWGIFVSGAYTERCRVKDNRISASVFTQGSIGVGRAAGLDLDIVDNDINGPVLFSSSGGSIRFYGNRNYTLTGNTDSAVMEKLYHSSGSSLQVADVKFIRSQQIVVPASSTGAVTFELTSIAANAGKCSRVTFTSKLGTTSAVVDSCEQRVLITNQAGSTQISAGSLQSVLGNAASNFTTAFALGGGGTGLQVQLTNPNSQSLAVRIAIEEYEQVT